LSGKGRETYKGSGSAIWNCLFQRKVFNSPSLNWDLQWDLNPVGWAMDLMRMSLVKQSLQNIWTRVKLLFGALALYSCEQDPANPHPIHEFLFGFEEEGYVFYPISHRNTFFFILLTCLFLLLLLIFVLQRMVVARRKVFEKNQQLHIASQKITSSIQYARKIQEALLPGNGALQGHFKEAFVLNLPKDIVSGDFFMLVPSGNRTLVLLMDCTGHGVPGAFLTLLAYQELRKLVYERGLVSPAEILFELHKEFSNTHRLHTRENTADGVDVGIICIDHAQNRVRYSGANMTLIRSHNQILDVCKGNRVWIGSPLVPTNGPGPFQDWQWDLHPEDVYYMSTDGFADQFGGPNDKKFLFQNLVALLKEIQNQPLVEQGARIEQAHKNWKGTQAQTDDVLVLGFKL
jgi:serine phosphatase RsbU (regulator of sigma subunit)